MNKRIISYEEFINESEIAYKDFEKYGWNLKKNPENERWIVEKKDKDGNWNFYVQLINQEAAIAFIRNKLK
jgi:hypothetical protein